MPDALEVNPENDEMEDMEDFIRRNNLEAQFRQWQNVPRGLNLREHIIPFLGNPNVRVGISS